MEIHKWAKPYPVGSFWWCIMNSHVNSLNMNLRSHASEVSWVHIALWGVSQFALISLHSSTTLDKAASAARPSCSSPMGQWTPMTLSLPSTTGQIER